MAGDINDPDTALRGEPSSYEQGMRDSSGHVGTLTAWGLINGTVGVVLGTLQSGGGQSTLFQDDFETARGWVRTAGANTATTGLWQRGNPESTYQNGVNLQLDNCDGGSANCMITGLAASVNAGVNDIDRVAPPAPASAPPTTVMAV